MSRTFYPVTLKQQVLSRIRSGREMLKDVAKSFGIPRGTLIQWWQANPTYKIHPEIEAKAVEMSATHPALRICKELAITKEALKDIRIRHDLKRVVSKYPRHEIVEKPNELTPILLTWGVAPELRKWVRTHKRTLQAHW